MDGRGATGAARGGEARPPPFAVAMCRRGPAGEPTVQQVDRDLPDLLGTDLERYLRSSAGHVLANLLVSVLARVERGESGATADLRLEDPTDRARALHCRLLGVAETGADAAVSLVLHDLTPHLDSLRAQMQRAEELLRLLRLSEILLEHPPREEGMVRIIDEIATVPGVRAVAVGLRDGGGARLRYSAHRGVPGRRRHIPFHDDVTPGACADAMEGGQIQVDFSRPEGPIEIYVPIRAASETLGILQMWADGNVSVDGWSAEILGSYADYLAALVEGAPARPRALVTNGAGGDTVDLARLLTERQQEVLFLLVDAAASNRTIAQRLGTTEATVKVHMRAIFDRLGIDSRAEALHLVFSGGTGWLAAQRARREQG
jgi:DNA-binding CsgD family transcriptional regulator